MNYRLDTRTALLKAGYNILLEKGYSNTGIREILAVVSVSRGSFYHYFHSKEDFALQVIRYADENRTSSLLKAVSDDSLSPLERIRAYCSKHIEHFLPGEYRHGCLLDNLRQELSGQNEALRQELVATMLLSRARLATLIMEGQSTGEINSHCTAAAYAEILEAGWTGAVLRSKTLKTPEPMTTFVENMFNHVLI